MQIDIATGAGWLGLAAVLAMMFLAAVLVGLSGLPRMVKTLLIAGIALRGLGSVFRYWVIFDYYKGLGDAALYYDLALPYADQLRRLDFSFFYDPTEWLGDNWWGTQFVYFVSAIFLTFIGSTILGEFIVFSLLAYVGLIGFAIAFRRHYPDHSLTPYIRWIWLFPSLWFWPASVGKEAIVLAGIGLAVAGFIGRGQINWILLSCGMFLVFGIRPQVAAVVFVSFVFAYWLSLGGRWTVWRLAQGAAILAVGVVGIWISLRTIGAGGFDAEGVKGYMASDPARRVGGKSSIEAVPIGIVGVPLGIINTLFRPIPFEAGNPMVLISSLEIWFFWVIAWFRRRKVMQALKNWQTDRLIGMALPFVLLYSMSLGMMVTNLGIIARQRVFLFPFLFLLLEAPAVHKRSSVRAPAPQSRGKRLPVASLAPGSA